MAGWSPQQKALIHIYKGAARLQDQEYRSLLKTATGCASAADRTLTQYDFDHAMAEIERTLDWRVTEGVVPAPGGKIRDPQHWRRRWSSIQTGGASSRLVHEIYDWWGQLQPCLPPAERTVEYLRGIASKACRCRIDGHMSQLKSWQAGLVVEALKDRLRYALRNANHIPSRSLPDNAPVVVPDHEEVETFYGHDQEAPADAPATPVEVTADVPF